MVGRDIGITWICILLAALFPAGYALKCYSCDNSQNPACGIYFKPYQFKATRCGGRDFKCALQRQPAAAKDGWVGIVRVCYQLGTLPGLNETDGCKDWTTEEGFTAFYCFCSTDYCNGGKRTTKLTTSCIITSLIFLLIVLAFMIS